MLSATFYILASLLAVLFLLYNYFGNVIFHKVAAHIPGPFSFPLIGCAYLLVGSHERAFKKFIKITKNYVSPIRFPVGTRLYILTANPEHIKTILHSSKTAEKDKLAYKSMAIAAGKGLVTAEHKLWRVHRKLLQPTFASEILKSFVSIFQTNSLISTQAMEKNVDCSEFEFYDYIEHAIFSNICESTLGVSSKTRRKEITNFLSVIRRGLELISERIMRAWLHNDTLFNWSQVGRETYKHVNLVYSFTQNVIEDRRKHLLTSTDMEEDNVDKKRNITLDLMLKLLDDEKELNMEEVRDHIITFIIAGYDTVARTLNFTLLMIASHPDIQDKIYEEIFNIYGDESVEENPVKNEDLQRLNYLERVIKESMRLFPVVPILARQASEDFELDGYVVPKNSGQIIFSFATHRDETIWPNPLKFDPDRFLPEASNERHPCAFIPFSFAAKDCLGRVYAMMSMKIFVVTLLRKYILIKDKITPVKDIRLEWNILLQPVEPIKLRIEKRRKNQKT